jgi:hypothetical protein
MKAISVFHLAIKEEVKDIIDSETQIIEQSDNAYGDNDGNLYFPLSSDEILKNNDAVFRYDGSRTSSIGSHRSKNNIRNKLKSQIKSIKYDLSKNFDIMAFLENVHNVPEIYGILIKSDVRSQYLINPLHPLTALAIKLGQIKIPEKGTIIIYEYKYESLTSTEIEATTVDKGYNPNFEKSWVSYISQSKYFINTETVQRNLNQNLDNYFTELEFLSTLEQVDQFAPLQFKDDVVSSNTPKALMVPLQMIVDSIATPYYGMILLKDPTRNSSVGYNTGMMVSGNIDHRHSSDYQMGSSAGKICTGSLPKERDSGWLTLNRVYLNSMWFNEIVTHKNKEWISMATTAKKIACDFYKVPTREEAQENENNSGESNEW